MMKQTSLILGSCLALQLPLSLGSGTPAGHSDDGAVGEAPLFSREHSRELLGDDDGILSEEISNEDLARFVLRKTRELLPVPFRKQSRLVARAIIETSNRHRLDPMFLMAIIQQESRFSPAAVGLHGEIGLMQIKPDTALWILGQKNFDDDATLTRLEETLRDPAANVRIGGAYIAKLRDAFRGESLHYIAAYNMGSAKLREKLKAGYQPHEYSDKVLAGYVRFAGQLTPGSANDRQSYRAADLRRFGMSRTYGL